MEKRNSVILSMIKYFSLFVIILYFLFGLVLLNWNYMLWPVYIRAIFVLMTVGVTLYVLGSYLEQKENKN